MCRCRNYPYGCSYACGFTFRRRYGFFSFFWDVFMTFLTCGLWLIWIFVREMRG